MSTLCFMATSDAPAGRKLCPAISEQTSVSLQGLCVLASRIAMFNKADGA